MSDMARLVAALDDLAAEGRCTTYGVLAAQIGLEGGGRISRLTGMLETLMVEDARKGQPLRASVVLGRASGGLPARGYFMAARALGLYDGQDTGPAAVGFHASQLQAVFAAAG
jgi:hypothetical protein